MADAATLDLFGQGLPQFLIVEGLPRAGVELVEVDVVAVALRGVEEVDAELAGAVQDGAHLGHGVVAAPLAAELLGADPDDGDGQVGGAEAAVFHGGLLNPGARRGRPRTPRVVRRGYRALRVVAADGGPEASRHPLARGADVVRDELSRRCSRTAVLLVLT